MHPLVVQQLANEHVNELLAEADNAPRTSGTPCSAAAEILARDAGWAAWTRTPAP
jgi:hypothetical protein